MRNDYAWWIDDPEWRLWITDYAQMGCPPNWRKYLESLR